MGSLPGVQNLNLNVALYNRPSKNECRNIIKLVVINIKWKCLDMNTVLKVSSKAAGPTPRRLARLPRLGIQVAIQHFVSPCRFKNLGYEYDSLCYGWNSKRQDFMGLLRYFNSMQTGWYLGGDWWRWCGPFHQVTGSTPDPTPKNPLDVPCPLSGYGLAVRHPRA